MRSWKLATPWIGSALALGLFALCAGAAFAQQDGEDACRSVCRAEATKCVSACAEADDPIECDSDCRDQREDCERECD